jgi:Zn ribbon nucleic-acid-binding protein
MPRNALEFADLYRDEEACIQALVQARWPDGFVCPKCGETYCWEYDRRLLFECVACGHQASPLAGTIFHGAKLSLRKLFHLVYLLVAEKSGTNMCALARQVGVAYGTALLWARKIRHAMASPGRQKLTGTVEVDETVLGGPAPGHPGRSLGPNQALVLVLVEESTPGVCGRVRLEVVASGGQEHLTPPIKANVGSGSTVRTDGWQGYSALRQEGYETDVRKLHGGPSAVVELPLVHRVASLLKRFMDGVLHGRWSESWLQQVLDEFAFRFNRRSSRCRPMLFNRVIESGLTRRSPTRAAMKAYAKALSMGLPMPMTAGGL